MVQSWKETWMQKHAIPWHAHGAGDTRCHCIGLFPLDLCKQTLNLIKVFTEYWKSTCSGWIVYDRVWNRPFLTWILPLWFIPLKNENNTTQLTMGWIYSLCGLYSFPLGIISVLVDTNNGMNLHIQEGIRKIWKKKKVERPILGLMCLLPAKPK